MRRLPLWKPVLIGCFWLLSLPGVQAEGQRTATEPVFSADRIEQLVAPIALYPDSVVAQILMAATYPLEIVQAQRWREENPDLEGKALEEALAAEHWDPSVKALSNFPDVLKRMNDNLDWTQDLGDAMLAQEKDVMDAIQHMRRLAQEAGNLDTTPEQKVIVREKVIVVEPATDVVYVPVYSPTVVYGTVWAPATYYYPIYSHPPSYWYPPGYVASNIVAFGVGMAVGAAIWRNWNWGRPDWRRGNININNNFNFSRNVNTRNLKIGGKAGDGKFSKWKHNAGHRGGVRYRDASTRQRFSSTRAEAGRPGRIDRDAARGFDRAGSRASKGSGDRGKQRQESRDQRRLETSERQRPQSRDAAGAGTRDRQRADSGGKTRPESRDRKRVETSERQRPQTRDAGRARERAVSREAPRSQNRGSGSRSSVRSGAFNVGGGGFDRAASKRGASSRGSGGGALRSGGGRLGR